MGVHMDEPFEETVDAAWDGFRARLADRLAELVEDEILRVEVETGVDEDELSGATPYLQFVGEAEGVHAEAVGNLFLDERFLFDLPMVRECFEGGSWQNPSVIAPNHHQRVDHRDVDRLAVACVRVLREVYGVAHPAFLDAEGLEFDADSVPPEPEAETVEEDEPEVVYAYDRAELQEAVDAAMRVALPNIKHDEEGDIPVACGDSVLFVRVAEDRPAISLFAEIVVDPPAGPRLLTELALLNETHPFARFALQGNAVVMSHMLIAFPFVPAQLRALVAHMGGEVDEVARTLAVRVGGRRFLEPANRRSKKDLHPGMTELVELLHLGRVPAAGVASLFDGDRKTIVTMLVNVREGRQSHGEHDRDVVLEHLRRALRFVVDGTTGDRRPKRLPPKPRSSQERLLDDDEVGIDSLDLGRSA